MSRSTKYFILLERHNHQWVIAFGDYDKDVVTDEKADLIDSGAKAKELKIIASHNGSQGAVNAAVTAANASLN